MTGPPGAGKTLLARSMPSILPRMTTDECLEVTKIYSVAGLLPPETPLIQHRPFRAPHHTISHAGLVGGGRWPRPGENTRGFSTVRRPSLLCHHQSLPTANVFSPCSC